MQTFLDLKMDSVIQNLRSKTADNFKQQQTMDLEANTRTLYQCFKNKSNTFEKCRAAYSAKYFVMSVESIGNKTGWRNGSQI
ncbi:Uncharacterized protein BM_BM12872 [Brugia malayi]|uniref:Uncharacterized protein n=1 Tax=Brugia malayi TaxID=6279 RepID=A0A4E9FIF7_BRUMA|nr:Uncharacterized protein BM_BM12872 [Brugia malayi]VIO96322.1 Uncharacterized protein BM_BM12872 [Brugia malayi]